MAILARVSHNGASLPVEVIDVFRGSSGRKVAQVRALDGQQHFSRWSHGGWIQSEYATFPADLVADVTCDDGIPVSLDILVEA